MDIVGLEPRASQLLHQVVLFTRATARADEGQRVAAMFFSNSEQTLADPIQGLIQVAEINSPASLRTSGCWSRSG